MPIPSPQKEEEQDEFIARCMADRTMRSEYSDVKQRAAVCYSKYRETKDKEKD